MKKQLLALSLLTLGLANVASAQNVANAYVWGQGDDGVNYCYATDAYGSIPEGEQPVDRTSCYSGRYAWVRSSNGFNYCYATDYNGAVASDEAVVENAYCGAVVQVPIILPVFRPYHHPHPAFFPPRPIIVGRPGPIVIGRPGPVVVVRPGPIFGSPRQGEFHGGGFAHGPGGHGPHRLDSDDSATDAPDTANNAIDPTPFDQTQE